MLSEVLRRDTLSQAGRARAAKAKPQTDAVWSLVGDAVFAVLVLSSVAWGLASIGHYKGWWDISSYLGEIPGRTTTATASASPTKGRGTNHSCSQCTGRSCSL